MPSCARAISRDAARCAEDYYMPFLAQPGCRLAATDFPRLARRSPDEHFGDAFLPLLRLPSAPRAR